MELRNRKGIKEISIEGFLNQRIQETYRLELRHSIKTTKR
jgi:hypothetical protein